jgi:hypothetical protein
LFVCVCVCVCVFTSFFSSLLTFFVPSPSLCLCGCVCVCVCVSVCVSTSVFNHSLRSLFLLLLSVFVLVFHHLSFISLFLLFSPTSLYQCVCLRFSFCLPFLSVKPYVTSYAFFSPSVFVFVSFFFFCLLLFLSIFYNYLTLPFNLSLSPSFTVTANEVYIMRWSFLKLF